MRIYKGSVGHTGVAAYETGSDFIIVKFLDGSVYKYTYTQPGRMHVDAMKKLAPTGKGLTTYINQPVRQNYEERLK